VVTLQVCTSFSAAMMAGAMNATDVDSNSPIGFWKMTYKETESSLQYQKKV
jgi:hypothetical protein